MVIDLLANIRHHWIRSASSKRWVYSSMLSFEGLNYAHVVQSHKSIFHPSRKLVKPVRLIKQQVLYSLLQLGYGKKFVIWILIEHMNFCDWDITAQEGAISIIVKSMHVTSISSTSIIWDGKSNSRLSAPVAHVLRLQGVKSIRPQTTAKDKIINRQLFEHLFSTGHYVTVDDHARWLEYVSSFIQWCRDDMWIEMGNLTPLGDYHRICYCRLYNQDRILMGAYLLYWFWPQ